MTSTIHLHKAIAAVAICNERTVARYLEGLPVRPSIRERIETAIRSAGHIELLRPLTEEQRRASAVAKRRRGGRA